MKINVDYYKKDIYYNSYENENEIIEKYINNYSENKYEDIIQNNNLSVDEFSALSEIRKNIISWYPLEKDKKILEIGAGLGEVTGELCKNAIKVVSVEFSKARVNAIAQRHKDKKNLEIILGNIKDIKFNEKFDYITLFGILEYSNTIIQEEKSAQKLLEICKNLLNENGKILIATDNKFAMRNWSNITIKENNVNFDAVSRDKSMDSNQSYSKKRLEEMFADINIGKRKYYYPLPDYKYTNVIFTDEHLPNEEQINRNLPIYTDDEIINFNENSAYKQLLKRNKELFSFFANSFFIEISENLKENDIEFVSFNNMRKSEFRMKTIIKNDEVYKFPVNEKAKEHLDEIKNNIDILKEHNINILDSYDNEKVISKYVKNVNSFDEIILNEFKKDGIDAVINIINKFKEDVISKFKITANNNNVFDKYSVNYEEDKIKKLNFLEIGFWDLLFQNSFYINNEFYFYDQEWRDNKVPLEFIIYRNIEYLDTLKRRIDINILYEKLNITQYIDLFKKLDDAIQVGIRDDKFFKLYIRPMKTVKGLYIENDSLNKQIEDKGYLIHESQEQISNLKENINNLENDLKKKNEEIAMIVNSKSWRFLTKLRLVYYKIKNFFKRKEGRK